MLKLKQFLKKEINYHLNLATNLYKRNEIHTVVRSIKPQSGMMKVYNIWLTKNILKLHLKLIKLIHSMQFQ